MSDYFTSIFLTCKLNHHIMLVPSVPVPKFFYSTLDLRTNSSVGDKILKNLFGVYDIDNLDGGV